MADQLPELKRFGFNLLRTRLERGLSQAELAGRCDLAQQQISMFEAGQRLPTLEQFLGLARVLDVPLQRLMSGADRPGKRVRDIAIELRSFGVTDLRVKDAPVPGAFRRGRGSGRAGRIGPAPDPRIIEAMPAVLAWAEMSWTLLKAYGIITGTTWRLAWLADVTLLIEKKGGFPGGCRKGVLEQFLKAVALPPEGADWTVSVDRHRASRRCRCGAAGRSTMTRVWTISRAGPHRWQPLAAAWSNPFASRCKLLRASPMI